MIYRIWPLALLAACGESTPDDPAEVSPAPLAAVSGSCPDLSTSGLHEITSAGVTRTFHLFLPDEVEPGQPVFFSWHGLSAAEFDPAGGMARGFGLEQLARDRGVIVVVPEAQSTNLLGSEVMLWGILDDEDNDLALYDDLRTCLSEAHDVDLHRISSWGHSGGALWTALLVMERSDTLASAVLSSGGVELTLPLLGDRLAYRKPAVATPMIISSGGATDVWPDMSLPVIQFDESSDLLADNLHRDGHLVWRCRHNLGHVSLPQWFWPNARRWMLRHRYGEPSPWEADEGGLEGDCEPM